MQSFDNVNTTARNWLRNLATSSSVLMSNPIPPVFLSFFQRVSEQRIPPVVFLFCHVSNWLLSDLYILPNIVRVFKSRRMRWAGHVARMGEGRGVHRVLVGKPEGKRPLGRPRRRWEDNIKMDLQEVGGGCEDWMELAQDRDRWRALVSTVMNLRVSKMRGIS